MRKTGPRLDEGVGEGHLRACPGAEKRCGEACNGNVCACNGGFGSRLHKAGHDLHPMRRTDPHGETVRVRRPLARAFTVGMRRLRPSFWNARSVGTRLADSMNVHAFKPSARELQRRLIKTPGHRFPSPVIG